jgi:hypothetical protein
MFCWPCILMRFWVMTNLMHSFLMYLFYASTCFEQQMLIIRRAKLYYYIIWYNTLTPLREPRVWQIVSTWSSSNHIQSCTASEAGSVLSGPLHVASQRRVDGRTVNVEWCLSQTPLNVAVHPLHTPQAEIFMHHTTTILTKYFNWNL